MPKEQSNRSQNIFIKMFSCNLFGFQSLCGWLGFSNWSRYQDDNKAPTFNFKVSVYVYESEPPIDHEHCSWDSAGYESDVKYNILGQAD